MTHYSEVEIFRQYLDPESESMFMQKQKLLPNAPPEAVEAFEQFKIKVKKEIRLEKEIGLYL